MNDMANENRSETLAKIWSRLTEETLERLKFLQMKIRIKLLFILLQY